MTKIDSGELFNRHKNNPIITAEDLPYRANSVFNAAAVLLGDETLLLLRVEDRRGHSHLTVARSNDGISDWRIPKKPSLVPNISKYPEDKWGIEDPRITYLEEINKYAILFTSYSADGPLVSLALTDDFVSFERKGAILKPEDKDAVLFPVKIKGKWAMLHRPYQYMSNRDDAAHVHISYSEDLVNWNNRKIIMRAREGVWWDAGKIGVNTPPLLTKHGWLVSYHGVKRTCAGCIYRLGLVILDTENPELVTHRSEEWVFSPQKSYEMHGDVGNVVFPCGWTQRDNELWLYYGAADTSVALAIANYDEVIEHILNCPAEEN